MNDQTEYQEKFEVIERLFSDEIERQLASDNKERAYYYRELFALVTKALYAYQIVQNFSATLKTMFQL